MSDDRPSRWSRGAALTQRIENGAIAVAVVLLVIAFGMPWWWLLAAFLLFDISALGYVRGARVGALFYNAVHSYTAPALVLVVYAALWIAGHDLMWLALTSACWAFHVAVDRALGYGLKLQDFTHTHLGRIGRRAPHNTSS